MPLLHDSEPSDGLAGFPSTLARTIELNEPRVPIGELGFTEGYALLDVGEDTQKSTSMHAAQYTTTSISQALKCASKLQEIPWYQARSFQLILNIKAASAIGIEFPPTLVGRADEVIE